MPIIATGSKTIIDLSDGKSLSVYQGSNQPRTQIHDVNSGSYMPDWSSTAGKLTITPVVYANQMAVSLSDSALSITWKRKEGSGSEANLTASETVSGNVLSVNANEMADVSSGMLTFIAYVTYTDPDNGMPINAVSDISFALIRTGENAKTAWISGEQVFKYTSGSAAATPAQIVLEANLQNVTMEKWQYKTEDGDWEDYPTTSDNATITGTTLIVKPTHPIWMGDAATIRVVTSDENVGDTTSVYKVSDGTDGSEGAAGQSACIAFLSNENISFAADAAGRVSAMTVTCNVVAYQGTTKITPEIGEVTGAVAGMTVTAGNAVDHEIPLSISVAASATLGGSGQRQGTLSVPVTSPVETTLSISWTKLCAGNDGVSGENAVVFSLYAPEGTVFTNGEGTLTIRVSAYDGANPITSGASYAWSKYASGTWTGITGETGSSITVAGDDVAGIGTYRCVMTYEGKTYQDMITLIDKVDNYQLDIDSTAGDIFKNGLGESVLIARLWQNGSEVDALKSTTYSVSAPDSPTVGDFFYMIDKSTPQIKMMRYSGSAWVDVTGQEAYGHERTYTWYRRDKDGNPLDDGDVFATGKLIFIDGDDVDSKTVFVCEVD